MANHDCSPTIGKTSIMDQDYVYRPLNEENKKFKTELQSIHLEAGMSSEEKMSLRNCRVSSKSNECLHEKFSVDSVLESGEKVKIECLPAGPPPRKPPRTFAYDIYKNVKGSMGEEVPGEETSELNKNSQSETPQPQPIYAVPLKKKKSNSKFIPKSPVRSKSDLTNKDISKPSIAPKPPHILNRAKRASVVDPLSSTEKDEEAAITSEFQRQAHIRYSLRRPKKPPPAPPPYSDMEGNTLNNSVNSPSNANILTKSNTDIYSVSNVLPSSKNTFDLNCDPNEFHGSKNISQESFDLQSISHSKSLSSSQGIPVSDYEDIKSSVLALRATFCSTHNLEATSPSLENDQPLSLGYCSVDSRSPDTTDLYKKRSMSDETLYKGSRHGDEPIYATPIFNTNKGSSSHSRQRELHYMEEADAGRDGTDSGRRNRRNSTNGKEKMLGTDTADGGKGRSSLISAWKRDFRQSCRQVQNKIKKTVIR
ncbi:uncharacterized protein LOC121871906 [Homarus americanus]|uniref:uncharacterized protein LOC121871906 n=1 Tax=Homarus americanus TaxID=6706 RepID=UPI001C48FEFB|nr:uncharacterized protein LOC121871906 [Homarus americanus]